MKRRWLFLVLAVVFAWMVYAGWSEIRETAAVALRARWGWVLVSTALLISRFVLYALLYRMAFAIVSVESRVRILVPLMFAALVANLASSAASGALFVDDASRRGQPACNAVAGIVLATLIDNLAFVLPLFLGMGYLALHSSLRIYEIVAAMFYLLYSVALLGALLLGEWQPQRLHRILRWLQHLLSSLASRLRRKPPLQENWADENAACFTTAVSAGRDRRGLLLGAFGIDLTIHLIGILALLTLFPAFLEPATAGIALAGYTMGTLFSNIGITPQGIGVVEGAMALTCVSLGVPSHSALAIGLAFRGASFWLPMVFGFFFLSRSRSLRR